MVTTRFRQLILLLVAGPAALLQARDTATLGERPSPGGSEWVAPLEAELRSDMADGQLDQFTLLEAALIASRVCEPSDLQIGLARYAEISSRLAGLPRAEQTPSQRAVSILMFLHQQVLTGTYQPSCTELDRTLATGDFNCVTATVLYRCLSSGCDLPVVALARPGHVYCQLTGSEAVVIQTTSPQGFVAGEGLAGDHAASGAGRRLPGDDGRLISDVELVAKIYYNRGVNLLAGEAFASALPLLELASELDPGDRAARRNVLACLNNWALAECRSGRYERALQRIAQGLQIDPDYPAFADNEVYIHGCWARQLVGQGRFAEASELLQAACRRRPSVELFQHGLNLVHEAWIEALLAAGQADQAAIVQP